MSARQRCLATVARLLSSSQASSSGREALATVQQFPWAQCRGITSRLGLQQQLQQHAMHQPMGVRAFHEWRGYKKAFDAGEQRTSRGIAETGMYLAAVVIGMLGLSYASVPLYRMFCQATGYAGTVKEGKSVEEKIKQREENPNPALDKKAAERELRVWFNSDVAEGMPWRFTPTQEFVKVKPGQSTLVFFTAENTSDKPITGVSTYNVVPDKMGYYFNKIQCFCFEEQRLRPGEKVDMPVFFYIDPEMVEDNNCRKVTDLTLSYTFFQVEDEGAEERGEEAYGVKTHGALPLGQLPPAVAAAAGAAAAGATP